MNKELARTTALLAIIGWSWIAPQAALAQLGGVTSTVNDTTSTVTDVVNDTTSTLTGGGSTGGTSTSSGDTTPPTVTMTSPSSSQTVSGTITVSANATDSSGIAVVRFYVDAIDNAHLIKEEFNAPYSFSWNTTAVRDGSHRIAAVARDKAGNETISAPITFTVANDITQPTITINQAADQADPTSASPIRFTVVFSESVIGFTAADVTISGTAGGIKMVTLTCGSNTYCVEVSGMTTGGTVIATIAAGVARDAAGNTNTASTSTDNIVTFNLPDTTPPAPTIANFTPASGPVGTVVTISGTNFTGATAVAFNGVSAAFTVNSSISITATVPSGATSGPISVTTPGGTATSVSSFTVTVSTSVTRSEESAASFVGAGWTLRGPEIAAFSGGTAASSNVGGDTASFTFTGTAVSWIGLKCNVCGIATVSIDGGAPVSVDTAGTAAPGSPGLTAETVFTASGLTAGSHTMVITVTGTTTSGGAHIVVDAFDVTGGTGSAVNRIEENHPAVSLSPTAAWVPRGPEIAVFSGGAAVSSNVTGATAAITFTGTAVSWIGLRCSVCGTATVSIDGGAANSVDTTGAAVPGSPGLTSETVFTASGLAAGTHTLVITVTGTTTSGGAHIVVDAVDVTP